MNSTLIFFSFVWEILLTQASNFLVFRMDLETSLMKVKYIIFASFNWFSWLNNFITFANILLLNAMK